MHFAAWNPAHELWSTLCSSSSVCQQIAKWAERPTGSMLLFSSPCRIHLINVAVPVARRPHYLAIDYCSKWPASQWRHGNAQSQLYPQVSNSSWNQLRWTSIQLLHPIIAFKINLVFHWPVSYNFTTLMKSNHVNTHDLRHDLLLLPN